jgi:UDP-N-acetylglucosamine diphosphorylase/glucosamine-1-phosphate N-acetyltransferase
MAGLISDTLVLFEDSGFAGLFPLTLTCPVWELRIGIDCIIDKWKRSGFVCYYRQRSPFFDTNLANIAATTSVIFLNSRFLPTSYLLEILQTLAPENGLISPQNEIIAARTQLKNVPPAGIITNEAFPDTIQWTIIQEQHLRVLRRPYDIFLLNSSQLNIDFEYWRGRSAPVTDKHTIIYAPENVYIAPDAVLRACIINAEPGPVWIGAGAEIQEGAIIRGAHAIGDHAVVHPGTRLRGDSTIGPYAKVGGEISNSVIQGYTNKAHDGFLGNSVLGKWCNLGAGTTVSNLKNNYSTVQVYDYQTQQAQDSGLQFCGLIMGDHSKSGIQTAFNTGTVVGVCCNIFDAGFPAKFIRSFSWGGAAGFTRYTFDKAIETITRVMARRRCQLQPSERALLKQIYENAQNE